MESQVASTAQMIGESCALMSVTRQVFRYEVPQGTGVLSQDRSNLGNAATAGPSHAELHHVRH